MAGDPQNALDWLSQLADQGGGEGLTHDQAIDTRSELESYYSGLGGLPAEPGYEDREGTQAQRPGTAYQGRQNLSPVARSLADADFFREVHKNAQKFQAREQELGKQQQSAEKYIPAAYAALDVPKNILFGYGPSLAPIAERLTGHTREQATQAYSQGQAEATFQRVREQHPDWDEKQVGDEVQRQVREGAVISSQALERFLPGSINLAAKMVPIGLTGGAAAAAMPLAEGAGLAARIGMAAARGAVTGAAYEGLRAREPGDLDEAGSLYSNIASRVKTAAQAVVPFAAGNVLSSLVEELPISGQSGWMTRALGDAKNAQQIADWVHAKMAGTAAGVGYSVGDNPAEALRRPGATIAQAMAASLLPQGGRFGAGLDAKLMELGQRGLGGLARSAGVPEEVVAKLPVIRRQLQAEDHARALELKAALVDNAYSEGTDDAIAALNGLKFVDPALREEILGQHRAARERQDWNTALGFGATGAGQVREGQRARQGAQEADALVSQGMEARAAKMPGSAEEEQAGQEFQAGVAAATKPWERGASEEPASPGALPGEREVLPGEILKPGQSIRMDMRTGKSYVSTPGRSATPLPPPVPPELQALQELHQQAMEQMLHATDRASDAKTPRAKAYWERERQEADRRVNGVLDQITKLQKNTYAQGVDAGLVERAKATKIEGADEQARAGLQSATADAIEAAPIPPQPPPADQPREPGEGWSPSDLEALGESLKTYYRNLAVLQGTQSDAKSPARARLESETALLKADLDKSFFTREGRTLDELIATTKSDSPLWWKNPALSRLSSHLGFENAEGVLSHSQEEGKSVIGDADALTRLLTEDANKRVDSGVRDLIQQRLRGVPDFEETVSNRAFDVLLQATQAYARATRNQPRDEAWASKGTEYAVKQAVAEARAHAKRLAAYYGLRDQAMKYMVSTDADLAGTKRQIDESATKVTPRDNPLSDVDTLLALAKGKGGPLENLDDPKSVIAANIYLNGVSQAQRKKAGVSSQARDVARPGRSAYDYAREAFITQNGQKAWDALTNAQRMASGRALERELRSAIKGLDLYMKQLAGLRGANVTMQPAQPEPGEKFGPETGAFDTQMPVEFATRMAGFVAKNVRSLWTTQGEDYWRMTRDQWAAKPEPSGLTRLIKKAIAPGVENWGGTTGMGRMMEVYAKGEGDYARWAHDVASRSTGSVGALADQLTTEQRIEVGKWADGYRTENDGKPVVKHASDQKFLAFVKAQPLEQQEALSKVRDLARTSMDRVRDYVKNKTGIDIGYVDSYLPHYGVEEVRSVAEKLGLQGILRELNQFRDAYERDASEEQAAKTSGNPWVQSIMSRSAKGGDYDLDFFRSFLRYGSTMMRFAKNFELYKSWQDIRQGKYETISVPATTDLSDKLSRFVGASDAKDAIKIGGAYWKVADKMSPGQNVIELRNIGRPGEAMVLKARKGDDGNWQFWRQMTTSGPPGPHGEPQRYVTSERPVFPQIRQGGLEQMSAVDAEGNLTGKSHEKMIADGEEKLRSILGPKQHGLFTKAINGLGWLTNLSVFGLRPGPAARNMLVGSLDVIKTFGPDLFAKASKAIWTDQGKALLNDAGVTHPDVAAHDMLPPGTSSIRELATKAKDYADKTAILMKAGDHYLRSLSWMAGYMRARNYARKFGVPSSDAAQMAGEGIPPEQIPERWARRDAYVSAGQSANYFDAINAPQLLRSPWGRLLLQFKKPAILSSSATWNAAKHFAKTGNAGMFVRFAAITSILAYLDDLWHTNLSDVFSTRVADLGRDVIGAGPDAAIHGMDDPKGAWHAAGSTRIPLSDPFGVGPVLQTMGDVTRWAINMANGDDDALARQFFEAQNLKQRLEDTWIPGYRSVRQVAGMLDPSLPITRMTPSGDTQRPWMMLDDRGRPKRFLTRELLWREFLLGGAGSREQVDTLRRMQAWKNEEEDANAERSLVRRKWYDAQTEAERTGSPDAMMRAEELRARIQATPQDFEREYVMRHVPNWARLNGTNEEKAKRILEVANDDQMGVTRDQLRNVLELTLKDWDRLTPDTARRLGELAHKLYGHKD